MVVGKISTALILEPNASAVPFNSILRVDILPTPNTELRSWFVGAPPPIELIVKVTVLLLSLTSVPISKSLSAGVTVG